MKLFRLRTVADLKRNYILSSSRLKVTTWLILGLLVCILLTVIANIRAPDLIKIPLFILAGFVIYKFHRQLKYFRYNLDYYLIIRESLLYVLHTISFIQHIKIAQDMKKSLEVQSCNTS